MQFHSTETALLKVYTDCILAADEINVVIEANVLLPEWLILLGFYANFDFVDQCILLILQ